MNHLITLTATLHQAQTQLNTLTPEALTTQAGADQLEAITLQLIELQLTAFEQDNWGLGDLSLYLDCLKDRLRSRIYSLKEVQ